MQLTKFLIILFASILITACASSGNDFKENNISQLQLGITSQQDVENILQSKPYQIINNQNGEFISWIYSSSSPLGANTKMLQLQFIDNKLVRLVQYSGFELSAADRSRLMP